MDSNTINNKTQTRIPPPRGYALSGKIMLSAIVVLFSVVLIILFVHLYVRWRVYRRRSLRRRRRNPLIFAASGDLSPPSPAVSRGLDPAVIKSLHVSLFSAEDLEDDDVAECAVCINEFEEGDKVRVLPRCGHRFHVACIDMWFGSHNSCPLCRSAVEVEESAESPAAARGQRCDPATGSSSENQEVRIEIGRREEEVGLGLGFGRILGIKKFLFGDLRMNREEGDIERGEAVGGAPAAVAASVA